MNKNPGMPTTAKKVLKENIPKEGQSRFYEPEVTGKATDVQRREKQKP